MGMSDYKKEVKITLWAFGIGFILSVIVGLIVGNPVAISLIRAFIASTLFSVVVFGIIYIVKRYVPEILELQTKNKSSEKKQQKEMGAKVDYVVGEKVNSNTSVKDSGKNNEDNEVNEVEDLSFKDILEESSDNIEKQPENLESKKPEQSDEASSEKSEGEEEELPPIEELFNEEEQDIVPEAEIQEEDISGSDKKVKGSYIEVGDVKIPNEPEIIAKAIKKVMKEDE